jgi:hypothetical protein
MMILYYIIILTIVLTTAYSIQYSKGKASPLQALTGPEGSRSLRLPDFNTVGI